KINFIKQVIRLRARAVLTVEASPPEFFADRAVVIFRPDAVRAPDVFNLILTLVRDSVSDEQLAPRRCRRRLGWPFVRMNERASLTNAAVNRLPSPTRNPRRDCSMKKPSKISHAPGGLATYCCPCGPHRRCHRCRSRLVGGTVRSSQDAWFG